MDHLNTFDILPETNKSKYHLNYLCMYVCMYLGSHRSKTYIPHHLVISQFTLRHHFVFIIILSFNLTDHFMFVCCPLVYTRIRTRLIFTKPPPPHLLFWVSIVYRLESKMKSKTTIRDNNSLKLSGSVDLI